MFGSCGSIARSEQPVSLSTYNTRCQVLPPSVVLYTPRCSLLFHRCPVAATYTTSEFFGSTTMRAIRSESSRPINFQVSPASVVLYRPVPTDTLLRVHDSPVPTQTVSG